MNTTIGRYYAIKNKQCPKDIGGICSDCPDSCPLDALCVGDYIIGRNNPDNHPEDFIDEYQAIYCDDNFKLDYNEYGYYFIRKPEYWNNFVEKVYQAIKGE